MREIIFYKNYFYDFYNLQTEIVKEKIDFVLTLISRVERVPVKFFKYLEGSDALYEIKVHFGNNDIRFFCFFDEGNLIVAINGFYKKTQKTPKNELKRQKKLK
jgi:hypothetical protein